MILDGQKRIEAKLDRHIERSNKQHTDMSVALAEGESKFDQHAKVLKEHSEILEGVQKLKYKAIGAAVLGSAVLSLVAYIITLFV